MFKYVKRKKNYTINETTYLKVSKRLQREYMDVKKAHTCIPCLSLPVSFSLSIISHQRKTNKHHEDTPLTVFQTKMVSLRITKNKLVLRMPGVEENVE